VFRALHISGNLIFPSVPQENPCYYDPIFLMKKEAQRSCVADLGSHSRKPGSSKPHSEDLLCQGTSLFHQQKAMWGLWQIAHE
jgi:hypothetical protein